MIKGNTDRCICRFGGGIKGPLLIGIGAIHGNEKAGVQAMQLLEKMLEVEPITNPAFEYKGAFVGLIGNMEAYHLNQRYIQVDLNRIWLEDRIDIAANNPNLLNEEKERSLLITAILAEIEKYEPTETIILDLHTTSSDGGIFTIPPMDTRSIEIARSLHAPVITHMLDGVKGTMINYLSGRVMQDSTVSSLVFESGQHNDPISINRSIAALINCMKAIGAVSREHVENIHDEILITYSEKLPKLSKLIYKHHITPQDQFVMNPGFKNFQKIEKGEILASDRHGLVSAPCSGLMLMPLYQNQGAEGFYIIEPKMN